MEVVVLKINRKTGKYEGKAAVPFRNQATVTTRHLSTPNGDRRRLALTFQSGHRYVADLERGYFQHFGTEFEDHEACLKLVNSKLSDAEVFRRAIRDFSKQLPLVYERWWMNEAGGLGVTGDADPVQRTLPHDLLYPDDKS